MINFSKNKACDRDTGPQDPSILCHPNIPKPLHGISPRVVLGSRWWDNMRLETYKNADYCCQACGAPKETAKGRPWLEAHEIYDIDYETGHVIFKHCVALCHYCHNYIHDGRMAHLVNEGEMSEAQMMRILFHGDELVKKAGLENERANRHEGPSAECPWGSWRMLIYGKPYGPSTASFDEWAQGLWKNWKSAPR